MGVCNCSMFCCTLFYVDSSIAIIFLGKRELVALLNLSSWCLVMVEWLFLVVPWGCLWFVIGYFLILLTIFVKGSIDHCSHDGGSFIQSSNDHCSHHGGSFIQSSNGHCSHHGGSFILGSNGHCSHQGGSFIQGSTDHCFPEGGSFIQSSNGHCSHHGGSFIQSSNAV